MQSPYFSVIIPTYNRAYLVGESIESFLKQTFKDFEIIIVDDGSTDNTKEVIREYLSDPRIKYIYQENKERGAARNRGAKEAKGLYLNFYDSDDIALPDHLEKAHELIMQHGVEKVLWLYGNYSNMFNRKIIDTKLKPITGWITKELTKGNFTCILTIFIKKDFFDTLLFNEDRKLSIVEDWELCVRASLKAPIFYQPVSTVLVRQHENRSMAFPDEIAYANTIFIEKIYDYISIKTKFKKVIAQSSFLIIAIAYFGNANQKASKVYFKKALTANLFGFFKPKMVKWFIRIFLLPLRNFTDRFNRILYVTYNGLCQPLGQSQVIPYIIGLSKQGYKFTVLSFEHHYEKDFEKEHQKVKTQLDEAGIRWIALKYHKYPRFFSSIYDIMHGIIKAIRFYTQEPYYIVHARGHVPGMMTLFLKKLLKVRFIFDIRDMMADEKIDAGQWKYTSLSYRITKYAEKLMLKGSDAIVVLTYKISTYLKSFYYINTSITIIPTCVDMSRFPLRDKDYREQMRNELGISDRIVITYSGSIGTYYLFDKMTEFFKEVKTYKSKAHFLLLNRNEHDYAQRIFRETGVSSQDYTIIAVSPDDVHDYLWASDIGIFFYKPTFSRISTFPTKFAEYLACGLPVVGNAGVGDTEELILGNNLGSIVNRFDEKAYKWAFEIALAHTRENNFQNRAIEFVSQQMSVEVGVKKYKEIYDRI